MRVRPDNRCPGQSRKSELVMNEDNQRKTTGGKVSTGGYGKGGRNWDWFPDRL